MNYLEKYGYHPDAGQITNDIQTVVSNLCQAGSREVLMKCFSIMDLTSLHSNDTVESVGKLVGKVNALKAQYPDYPKPASICVYPNFAGTVASLRREPEVHVTVTAGCFPSSQSFLEVKLKECELAVRGGADEVDIVLALNSFLVGDYESAATEIREIRKVVDSAGEGRKIILKVILETGLLRTVESIAAASFLAMEAGADFIKTSTGKVEVNATPTSAWVMCECIRTFYSRTGRKVGFKAAGGISDYKDALCYYFIVSTVLGQEWLDKSLFRLGVSRLGNSLMSAIEQCTVNYF